MKASLFATAAALTALTSAQTLQAQQTCYASADLADTAVYMMPIVYDSAKSACRTRLKSDGFFATGGSKFVEPFRAKQKKAWPGAYRVMKRQLAERNISGMNGKDIVNMLSSMPDSTVRPMADSMMKQMISGEIKPDQCVKIERMMQLLSPLPADNVAQLFPLVADVANMPNFQLCSATKKQTSK